ncbi:hypothetical protein J2Y59_004770 [Arcicella sp. BE139]|nr:hypothetical protein [Arcicella sp. BE139]
MIIYVLLSINRMEFLNLVDILLFYSKCKQLIIYQNHFIGEATKLKLHHYDF